MAEVETHWFSKGGKNLIEQEIGWVASPINVMLMAAGYVIDQDGPEVYADVSASEVVGAGYIAGGTPIAARAVALDVASNETRLLGDPTQWATTTLIASGAIIYATSGAKPVLGYCDFGEDRPTVTGLFRIEWPANGVLRLRAL